MPKGRIITDRSVTDALVGELAGAGARKTEKYGDRAAGRQIHRYVSAALVLATPYLFTNCSDSTGPPDPNGNGNGKNNAPSATVNIESPLGIIYTDSNGDVVINVNYSDRDGDPENTGKRETWFERNDQRLSQYDGRTSVPLSAFSPQAGTKIEGCARVHDGHDYSAPACASKIVQGIPTFTVEGQLVFYKTRNPLSGQTVVLGPDTLITGGDGRFRFVADSRSRKASDSPLIVVGNDYYGAEISLPNSSHTTIPPIMMVDSMTSDAGVDAFSNWAYLTGKDGKGRNTNKNCYETYPLKAFIGNGSSNAGIRSTQGTVRDALFGPQGWNVQAGLNIWTEVSNDADANVVFTYASGAAPNYDVERNNDVVPIGGTITLPIGADMGAVFEETGHLGLCIWKENPNRSFNHSVIGAAGSIQKIDKLFYAPMAVLYPNGYDVSIFPATRRGGNVVAGGSAAMIGEGYVETDSGLVVPQHVAEGRTVYGPEDAQFVGPVRMVVPVRSRIMKFDAPGFRDYKGLSLPDNLVADLVLKDYGIDPRDMPRPMDVFDTEPKGLNWNGGRIDPDNPAEVPEQKAVTGIRQRAEPRNRRKRAA